jgi:hypothetical protein
LVDEEKGDYTTLYILGIVIVQERGTQYRGILNTAQLLTGFLVGYDRLEYVVSSNIYILIFMDVRI